MIFVYEVVVVFWFFKYNNENFKCMWQIYWYLYKISNKLLKKSMCLIGTRLVMVGVEKISNKHYCTKISVCISSFHFHDSKQKIIIDGSKITNIESLPFIGLIMG